MIPSRKVIAGDNKCKEITVSNGIKNSPLKNSLKESEFIILNPKVSPEIIN
jgi:16S rRNA G966 N2-methylase RsmD